MTFDPHPWAQTLPGLYDQAWTLLARGVRDRRSAARHVVLATVTPQGRPQARTVVLRAADRDAGTLDIHTDLLSAKVADLRATPWAAVHVWDSSAHLQLRLEAEVSILTGAQTVPVWQKVPEPARLSYGSTPPPGHPVPEALAYRKAPDPSVFAILRLTVHKMDLVHLGPDHRRAEFERHDGWAGQWLAP